MDVVESSSTAKRRLILQIAEAYANLFYTYRTQQAAADRSNKCFSWLSVIQIVLTSISACGFVGIALSGTKMLAVVSAGLSVVSLAITIYLKGSNPRERADRHAVCADEIWTVLQEYQSLLVDCDSLDLQEIKSQRDYLHEKVSCFYAKSPRTSSRAYSKARKGINNGDFGFSLEEIKHILPVGLRDLVR